MKSAQLYSHFGSRKFLSRRNQKNQKNLKIRRKNHYHIYSDSSRLELLAKLKQKKASFSFNLSEKRKRTSSFYVKIASGDDKIKNRLYKAALEINMFRKIQRKFNLPRFSKLLKINRRLLSEAGTSCFWIFFCIRKRIVIYRNNYGKNITVLENRYFFVSLLSF